jgi:cell division protein FtsL
MHNDPKTTKHWGDLYAERAQGGDVPAGNGITIPPVLEARDRVYGGTMPTPDVPDAEPGGAQPRNRRSTKRTFSPFNIILLLLGVAIVSVLYISNVLAVGQLLRQIDGLERMHRRLQNDHELLHAQINRLSSLERVSAEAQANLGLRTPSQAPVWLTADEDRVRELEQALQDRRNK